MINASPGQYTTATAAADAKRIIPGLRFVQTVWTKGGTVVAEHTVIYTRSNSRRVSQEFYSVNPDYIGGI